MSWGASHRGGADRTGQIDVLVNNAGVLSSAPAEDETAAALRQRSGSIINITSVAAHRSMDKYELGVYATGKAALTGLTRELAAQGGRDGIRVNAIAPASSPPR